MAEDKSLELISEAIEFEQNFFASYEPSEEVEQIIIDRKYFMVGQDGGGNQLGELPESVEDLLNPPSEEEQINPRGGFDTDTISEEKPTDLDEKVEYKGKKQRF